MIHSCQGREEEKLVEEGELEQEEGGELVLEEGRGGRGEEASKGEGPLWHRWHWPLWSVRGAGGVVATMSWSGSLVWRIQICF